ncbi:50S ribosomal protein L7/L12 [Brachyspira hyodysenteriae]|uniref:Large ribosomal subunit protein bL12 n=5 Tax=Brachyspira TaxID=29521 RepID=RL7_BRAHW|nr:MULTISPECIES: 50S ribosomal protein L7/L12 [Brachyspira]C0QWX5.1 RecName: Full=Large ribosomal subunit protein bL12; AltName: Full=50S ribosomal protein L7/L12 [Brachyspira hyodysenteriae WA1]ACN84778.1 50S ribosomal protein L7/L12 [Brachyspira hyodysenteriae WA1]AEM22956.1 50S ribosomal protein L7/L12 [Brachyspira intermedia PWS/A]ANN63157.1 50S ribosomal protein L7/L12 [Brachyspira hyodysenteriae ATCC 27164]ASJ20943.1 50S ribosomal protein L7/L12 [Brachyspira hampsonii]AUJ50506.1 50S rib
MALSKEEILQAIEEMKVIELHELVEAIKEKFNVTAAMPVAAVAAAPAGGAAAPAEEEKNEFDIILTGFDAAQKIALIKEVRAVSGLGLKEAKDAVEKGGETIKSGVSKEEAAAIKKQLEAAGGKVEVK